MLLEKNGAKNLYTLLIFIIIIMNAKINLTAMQSVVDIQSVGCDYCIKNLYTERSEGELC